MRYRFAILDKKEPSMVPVDDSLEAAAEMQLKALATRILDGETMSRKDFRNSFGTIWYAGMKREQFLFRNFSHVKHLSLAAVKVLDALYNEMVAVTGRVVAVGSPFDVTLELPGKRIQIVGEIPMIVTTVPFSGHVIYYFRRTALRGPIRASMDYVAYALSYAFRAAYRKAEKHVVAIDLGTGSLDTIRPTRQHYMRLRVLAELMASALHTGFPPMPGTHCERCGYRKLCEL